ncbi:MAG: aldo/keto reductase [Thiohalocapsa sp.]|nr:aldo/keto reductase [Thiohalocapsa sp.]
MTLGDTGIQVSPIGLGLAALGRPGYINLGHGQDLAAGREVDSMRAHCHAMLDRAWAAGVRYFDAARSYGLAEDFLGSWLRASGYRPAVGSKWGYTYTAAWRVDADVHEVKDHGAAVLERQWQETGERLGPWLRLYQIHSATLDSGVLDDAAVLSRLAFLKAGGTAVGLSLSGPRQQETLRRALAVRVDGIRLFDTVQATWNLLEPSAGPALSEASAAGLGVIVKEAVANGRLTERGLEAARLRSAPRGFAERAQLLRREAERLDAGVDALALAGALPQPWATLVLSGAGTASQLDANLAALDVAWDAAAADALRPVAESAEDYWRHRGTLAWN